MYVRPDSAQTNVIAPSVLPRADSGTISADRSRSSRTRFATLGSSIASIISSVISGTTSVRPVLITCPIPVGDERSGGRSRRSSCAIATFSGSTCATATDRIEPSDSRISTDAQSASRGTTRSATAARVFV